MESSLTGEVVGLCRIEEAYVGWTNEGGLLRSATGSATADGVLTDSPSGMDRLKWDSASLMGKATVVGAFLITAV